VDYRTADDVYRALHDGDIDLGIVAYPSEMPRIECLPFLIDHLVLVCQKEHPLAQKKAVKAADLTGQNFVQFSDETPTRRATDAVMAERDLSVNVRMECDNIEVLKQMVELGFGISLLPRNALTPADHAAGLRAVTVTDLMIERPVGVLLLKNAPRFKAVRAFVETLCGSNRQGAKASGKSKS
jgi:DNA-binding transcriptional LysR family regulator